MRIGLAFRAFARVLFNAAAAQAVEQALSGERETPAVAAEPKPEPVPKPPKPSRNDAITLLETLQREARFIDIVQEPLDQYSDEQVGAAARDVLRDCRGVLDRQFGLEPVVDQEEGSEVTAPKGYDTGRYRLTGNVTGEPPYQGRLVHHGWQASRCELPQWSGSPESVLIVAPVELEVS